MTRPATVDPVPFLARQLADWLVLWTFHRRGVVAAVEAMNSAGGCGRGEDEVWRLTTTAPPPVSGAQPGCRAPRAPC